MIEKALTGIATAAAVAAAAVIGVVAAGFALWSGLFMLVGQTWAAAIVAVAALLFVLAVVMVARSRGAGHHRLSRRDEPPADASLIEKAVELAKEHPLLAVGAAVGAGIYAIRNPQLVAAVVTAFVAGREEPK